MGARITSWAWARAWEAPAAAALFWLLGHWVWLCSSTVVSDKPMGKDVTEDLSFYLVTAKLNSFVTHTFCCCCVLFC